jgi:TonB family protein
MKNRISVLAAVLFACLLAPPISAQTGVNGEGSEEARKLNARAVALFKEGKYEEAIKLQKQALALWEKELGKESKLIVTGSTNLAEMYRALQRYDEAAGAYQRALKIQEKLLGPEHPDLVSLLTKLGWMRHGVAKAGEAEALFKRTVAISEKQGPDQPGVADPLLTLATFYQKVGRHDTSLPIYRRVIALQEKHFGPEGPQLVATLEKCACALLQDNKLTEANEMSRRAALIERKADPAFIVVAGQGVLMGEAIHKVQPHYPPAAKQQRLSGSVLIKVEIDESGAVTDAKILCGADLLAGASLEAALKWRFKPTTLDGHPVKVKGVLTFYFALQ